MIRAIIFWVFLLALCVLSACFLTPLFILFITLTLGAIFTRNRYCINFFIAVDQCINVLFGCFFNLLLCNPVYKFGRNPDETISSVLGKNIKYTPDETHKSIFYIDKVLSFIDQRSTQHSIDSIENDE